MKRQKNYHVGGQQMPLIVPDSDWRRPKVLPDLRRVKRIALDTEEKDDGLSQGRGPGWAYGAGYVCGVSVAWREEGESPLSLYAPIKDPDSENFSPEVVRRWILDHQRAGVRFVMQNAPYDVGWLSRDLEVPCPELIDDTTCMAVSVDENRREYGLDALCAWRGIPGKDESLLKEAMSAYGYENAVKQNLWRLPARFKGPYAEQDAVATLLLAESLNPEIDKQNVRDAYQLEMDLLPLVHEMRRRGVRIDLDGCDRAKKHFEKVSLATFSELRTRLADAGYSDGKPVGIDEARSNGWLQRVFDHCRVPYPKDEYGKGSFEALWMKKSDHWLPKLLVRAKANHDAGEKFIGNYVQSFANNGRLHASINQFKSESGGTRTYRFSYDSPPLQQMPHRDEEISALIRGVFLPEEGETWLAADYSQQEYRLIVHYAEVMGLRKAKEAGDRYRNDRRTDFHSMVAEMTGLERKPAKDTNFAKSYGAGVAKFAAMINKPEPEARAIMEQYDERMPFVQELFERCQSKAERTGFIKLLDGARIHFDTWEPAYLSREERARGWGSGGVIKMANCSRQEAESRVSDKDHPWYGKRLRRANCRKASNALIQGGAARQTKMAMRACWREGLVPLLQLHDELDFSVAREADGKRACEIMSSVVELRVPMLVDAEYGVSWGKAAKKGEYDASWRAARAAARGKRRTR